MKVVGVRFKPGGRTFLYLANGHRLGLRQSVVVETQAGEEMAAVALAPRPPDRSDHASSLRRVLRLPTPDDMSRHHRNLDRERHAMSVCQAAIRTHRLPMRLIDAQYTLDGSLVTINFAAENRVDFRVLVRDVASEIHSRVIFHQVGVRDRARALGTYAHCGQPLCCARFLTTLDPVSMRMAKDQGLSLNPTKFSGVCGKLMCCLRFEHDTYQEASGPHPQPGDVIETEHGPAEIMEMGTAPGKAVVRLSDGQLETVQVPHCDISDVCACQGLAESEAESEAQTPDPGEAEAEDGEDEQ